MGYSYQDIESRLRTVEEKLDFVMAAVRQPVTSGLVGIDGRPQVHMVPLSKIYVLYKRNEIGPGAAVEQPVSVPDATGDSSSVPVVGV